MRVKSRRREKKPQSSQYSFSTISIALNHTDFEKGFIKAEIVSFADLIEAGSMSEAKSKGKVRMEGKEYVMADGDVVEFRFNV